jgi:hypothetical protein
MRIQKKIEETLCRSVCGGWDRNFLESILNRLSRGDVLSAKQKQTLGLVLARNTIEDQGKHENWSVTYEQEYKADARILAAYHARQPYYKPMSADILAGLVPERAKFLRMHDNKYSKKVLSQHKAINKYCAGEYIMPRASFNSYKHCDTGVDMIWANQQNLIENFKKRGGFILEVCEEIYSAAKGAKRYKLLPIGSTIPIIIEERYLKMGRRNNQH